MAQPLAGTYAKLDRARHHARALQGLLSPIVHEGSWRFERTLEDPGTVAFIARGVPEVGPDVAATLGDFLTNLRAALDHLAWELAPESQRAADPRSVYFPILDKRGVAKIAGVTDEAVLSAVNVVQPFNESDPAIPIYRPLHALHRLCNIDKHRTFLVSAVALERRSIWWGSDEGDPKLVSMQVWPGQLTEGTVAARFNFGGRAPVGFEPNLELAVALLEEVEGWRPGQLELLDLIANLYRVVEFEVIGMQFAPLFGLQPRHQMDVYTP